MRKEFLLLLPFEWQIIQVGKGILFSLLNKPLRRFCKNYIVLNNGTKNLLKVLIEILLDVEKFFFVQMQNAQIRLYF